MENNNNNKYDKHFLISGIIILAIFCGFVFYQDYNRLQDKINIDNSEISISEYNRLEAALVKYHNCKEPRLAVKSALVDEKITVLENDLIIHKINDCITNSKDSFINAKKKSSIKNLKAISEDNYRDPNKLPKAVGAYLELLDAFAQELSDESNNN